MTKQPASDRQTWILDKLTSILMALSGLDLGQMGVQTSFLQAGLDSLFLIQLSTAIKQELQVEISFRQMIEQLETFESLVAYIDRHAPATAFPTSLAPASSPMVPERLAENVTAASATTSRPPEPVADPKRGTVAPLPPMPARSAESQGATGGGGLESIISQQLHLMSVQLQMLQSRRGGAVAPVPQAAPVVIPKQGPSPSDAGVSSSGPADSHAHGQDRGGETTPPMKPFGAIARINTEKSEELPPAQQQWLVDFIAAYNQRTAKSKAYTREHHAYMADPRVVTGFKRKLKELVYPIVAERSSGCHIWDLDGNEYVDALNGFGSNFFGYAHPKITQAVVDQLWKGAEIGPQCRLSGEIAKMIGAFTGMERVGFCNTGSEASLAAMRMARTVTGRRLIVTFTDSYHGVFDEVLVRGAKGRRPVPAVPGVMPSSVENILVLEYDSEESLQILRARGRELAAVMVEPIQTRRPELRPHAFLKEVRRITEESGTALIFDEVVTGFRMGPGGAQAYFGIRADLAAYGKVLGGGMSVGVVAGKARFMDALDGGFWQYGDDSAPEAAVTYFAGTFVRHPATMAACKAALQILQEGGQALYDRVNGRTARIVKELSDCFKQVGAPLMVTSFASVFRVTYTETVPYGDLLFYLLRHEGVHIYDGFPCYLSLAHSDEDVDKIIAAFKKSVLMLKQVGFLPCRGGEASQAAVQQAAWQPLSFVQKQYLVADTIAEPAFVHEGSVFSLRGKLDEAALERACRVLVLRHDALRIAVEKRDGEWLQRVRSSPEVRVEILDAQGFSNDEIRARIKECWLQVFDLARELPVRIYLFRHDAEHHTLFLLYHHIAIDGWSMAVIHAELPRLYTAEATGQKVTLPALPWSFMDHLRWEREMLNGSEGERLWQYWQSELSGELPLLNLPTDFPRPASFSHRGEKYSFHLSAELGRRIHDACQQQKVTPYMFTLAVLQLLLHRCSGQSDLLIGTMALNRTRPEHRLLVGSLVDVSVLRSTLSSGETFAAYLQRVRRSVLDMLSHAGYPYLLLAHRLQPDSNANQPPMVQVVFNWEDGLERPAGSAAGPSADPTAVTWERVKVPVIGSWEDFFLLYVERCGEEYQITVTYNTDLFAERTIARLMQDYQALLRVAVDNPAGSVTESLLAAETASSN